MAKIKVTRGGCGVKYTDGNGNARHAVKTPESGPFECDDVQAARFVGLGVAEYVDEPDNDLPDLSAADPAPQTDAQQGETGDGSQDPEKATGHLDAAQLESMTNEQLKELAAEMGVDVTGCKKKADYIAAIVAVEVVVDVDDPDNDLPDLSAADPE